MSWFISFTVTYLKLLYAQKSFLFFTFDILMVRHSGLWSYINKTIFYKNFIYMTLFEVPCIVSACRKWHIIMK